MKPFRLAPSISVLAVVIAVAAVLAPAAQGFFSPRWHVNKAFLAAGTKKSYIASSNEGTAIILEGWGVTIKAPKGECVMVGKIVGSAGLEPGTQVEATLACTSVTVSAPANCFVRTQGEEIGTLLFGPLKSTLVWMSSGGVSSGSLYAAETKAGIGVIEISGNTCGKNGVYPLAGEILGRFNPIEEEASTATETFQEPPDLIWWDNLVPRNPHKVTQLNISGSPVIFRTVFSFSLNPAEPVGVFWG